MITEEKISIVFDSSPGVFTVEEREEGYRIVKDLQIERAFRIICPDSMIREPFIDVICHSLPKMSETIERQKVIKQFSAHSNFLDRVINAMRMFAMRRQQWDNDRARLLAVRKTGAAVRGYDDVSDLETRVNGEKQIVATDCHYLRSLATILGELSGIIREYNVSGGYLGRLADACSAIANECERSEFSEFLYKCDLSLSNGFSFVFDFEVNEKLCVGDMILADFEYKRQDQQKINFWSKLTKKTDNTQNKENSFQSQGRVQNDSIEYGMELSLRALMECEKYVSSCIKGIYEKFSDIESELYFYKACIQYIDRIGSRGIACIYPEIKDYEENVLECSDLYDLLLLTESMSASTVVPNNVSVRADKNTGGMTGMLIHGKNNSGKTVYLRSVGTALLLAQNGLPIPAASAVISLRRGIYSHFAKSEGELAPASQAGRFEEETKELAEIINKLEPYSILLLNETFQTTAYDEGADGMYHILKCVSALGGGYIFVTHLTKLLDMSKDSTVIAKMSDNLMTKYKLEIESI